MEIKGDIYLNKLIRHRHNGLIKVITRLRRCGKSDSFKKIIIVKNLSRTHYSEEGILLLDLFEFLMEPDKSNV